MYEIDESEIELKFYELCRLCASYDNVKISLFSDEGKRRNLKKKIQSCLPFKVEENDGLPKSLCYKCVYNLESTYEFRHKCIQVNRNLEKHLYKREKEKQSSNQSHRIRPEVSIFALPPDENDEEEEEEENRQNASCSTAISDSDETTPNPLDFLEVGVNADDSSSIRPKQNASTATVADNKKQYVWKTPERKWLSVEHKLLKSKQNTAGSQINMKYFDLTMDENNESSSRRKNCNPRKIAREGEDMAASLHSTDDTGVGVTSISFSRIMKNSPSSSSPSPYGYVNNLNAATAAAAAAEEAEAENDEKTSSAASLSYASVIDNYKENQNEEPEEKTFTCLLCEKNFNTRSSLNKHFSTIHGIEPYEVLSQSTLLPQSFVKQFTNEKNDDEELENMMEQETVMYCEVCRREFHDRASLWLHMVHAHREEAAVSCGICLKICCDNITLIEHVNTAHSGDKAVIQRRYSCQVCGRQHDSRQKLLKHATLHTLIDNQGQTIQPEEMVSLNNAFAPRECPICHKKFFNEEKLNQHTQNFHNDTNDTTLSPSTVYRCELCTSTHATRIDRWWHMYHSHNGDNRVTCEMNNCQKIFVSPALKDEHEKSHHEAQGNFTNTCEICGKLWESRTVFYKHMMNVHPKCLPTICGICMKIFSNVPELRAHVQNDHPPLEESGGICCDVCGRPYAERSKMLRHRRVHNVTDGVPTATSMVKKKDDLICSFCPSVSFEKYEDIAEHRRTVHQLFVCDLCPKFYNGNNHLWKHVSKQHKGDPSVTCNICLRTSASRAHLERHKIKYHSDPVERLISKPSFGGSGLLVGSSDMPVEPIEHKCNLCGRVFRIRSLLKKHLKSCKGVKPVVPKMQPVNGVFPCAKCSKVFEFQTALSKHIRNSHIVHFCEACEVEPKLGFDTKKGLLQHIRNQHQNHPELWCDVPGCGKVLRLIADLKKHKLEHQRGYFTYICEICGDMFSNRKKLRKHLQTFHKSDVLYMCAVCNAIHESVDGLTKHVRTNHTFVLHRPFTCQICGKCYTVPSKTVDHVVKVHGKEFKPCKMCWKVFTDEIEFKEHTENHPPVEEKPSPPVRKLETKCKPIKSTLPQELAALGLGVEFEGSLKRPSEDETAASSSSAAAGAADGEQGNKRLRCKYRCVWCNETFRSVIELKEHKATEHAAVATADNSDQIVEDYEEVSSSSSLLLDTSGGVIAATTASASTSVPVAPISSHSRTETKYDTSKTERWTDIRPIACDCCDKIWNSKKQLWQHLIRSHPYESQHTCGICLQVCRNYYDLFYHLDASHSDAINDSANRFACFVCGHYHNSQSKLDKHFLLHKNVPPQCEYTCQYCQKVYKSVIYYRKHISLHEVRSSSETKDKPKSEPSEFTGFSINNILSTSTSSVSNKITSNAILSLATLNPGSANNSSSNSNNNNNDDDHDDDDEDEDEDDEKLRHMEAADYPNDEDLVELEEDSDSENENDNESDSDKESVCDENYDESKMVNATQNNGSGRTISSKVKMEPSYAENEVASSMKTEPQWPMAEDAGTVNVAVLNGGNNSGTRDEADDDEYSGNTNQKSASRLFTSFESEKQNFRTPKNEEYVEKMS